MSQSGIRTVESVYPAAYCNLAGPPTNGVSVTNLPISTPYKLA